MSNIIDSSIHDVTKISLGKVRKLDRTGKNPFFTRKVEILAKGKEVMEITCFADKKSDLEVEVKATRKF